MEKQQRKENILEIRHLFVTVIRNVTMTVIKPRESRIFRLACVELLAERTVTLV